MSLSTLLPRILKILLFFQFAYGSGVRQQTFREKPENVEVAEGQNVLLRCRVDYQKGQAQWTQNGFALGFNRTIPGFPRYKMIGNEEEGVHDLEILNATLTDDGEYQCQVTPMLPSQGIRHAANLTVLIPPSSLELEDDSIENGVKTVRSGEAHTLTCLAKNAKPAPTIEWFRGSETLRIGNQVDKEEPSDEERRVNLRSKITLTSTFEDNNVAFGCRAVHPALQKAGREQSTSVKFNVLYEPGPPFITGYTEGQVIKAGQQKTLGCKSRGGNPLPEVIWFRNGLKVDSTFNKHRTFTINDYSLLVNASDNNAQYECHVYNLMTNQPKKALLHMKVQFPPSRVIVTSPDEVSVGDIIQLSCEAQNSNPASDVSLVINGVSPVGITTTTKNAENGGTTTIVNLSGYQIAPTQQDLTVDCYAVNQQLGETKLERKIITVLRPPGEPFIFGYDPDTVLKEGQSRTITCQSLGGNPLPDLKWYRGTDPIVAETIKEGGKSTSHLNLILDKSDNGAEYRCEASNAATKTPLFNSTILTVEYPPERVKLNVSQETPKEGDNVLLTCTSSLAFPKANLSWWKDGFMIQGEYGPEKNGTFMGIATTYTINITATREMNGKRFTCNANNGFKSTTHDVVKLQVHFAPEVISLSKKVTVNEGESISIKAVVKANPTPITYTWKFAQTIFMNGPNLNLTKATKSDSGVYILEASNKIGVTYSNVTVDVKFTPNITHIKSVRGAKPGSRVSLECHFEGSPTPTIQWIREGYDFSRTETVTFNKKSILTFEEVEESDTGFFTCTATNEINSTTVDNVALVVDQPPIEDPNPKYQKAASDLGGTARLVCRVNAYPVPSFMWFTKGREPIAADVHTRYEVLPYQLIDDLYTFESVLLVKDVSPRDHGYFTCQVRNSYGMKSILIHLEGTTKPDPPIGLRTVNVSHNAAEISWEPGFDGGLMQAFRIRYNKVDSSTYLYIDVFPPNATQFWVPGLAIGTSYEISVIARNTKGESNHSLPVIVKTSSDAPLGSSYPGAPSGKSRMPGLVIILVTLVGAAILVINVALLTCFLKKKAEKSRLKASSDKSSSKSTAIEMYAPSSYTGTGETLSSISEKSRESYAQEQDSTEDYDVDATRVPAASTYLIDQLDPPPQYASRPPHFSHQPHDINMDDQYGDNMRRNQYNTALEYGTLGRRGNPTLGQDHYNISNADSYPRYNYVPPMANSVQQATHQNLHNQYNNGSLQRVPKMHFPKDYIRNGSSNPSPTKLMDSYAGTPTRMANPTLSTFTPDVAANTIPIEQRGHLV